MTKMVIGEVNKAKFVHRPISPHKANLVNFKTSKTHKKLVQSLYSKWNSHFLRDFARLVVSNLCVFPYIIVEVFFVPPSAHIKVIELGCRLAKVVSS